MSIQEKTTESLSFRSSPATNSEDLLRKMRFNPYRLTDNELTAKCKLKQYSQCLQYKSSNDNQVTLDPFYQKLINSFDTLKRKMPSFFKNAFDLQDSQTIDEALERSLSPIVNAENHVESDLKITESLVFDNSFDDRYPNSPPEIMRAEQESQELCKKLIDFGKRCEQEADYQKKSIMQVLDRILTYDSGEMILIEVDDEKVIEDFNALVLCSDAEIFSECLQEKYYSLVDKKRGSLDNLSKIHISETNICENDQGGFPASSSYITTYLPNSSEVGDKSSNQLLSLVCDAINQAEELDKASETSKISLKSPKDHLSSSIDDNEVEAKKLLDFRNKFALIAFFAWRKYVTEKVVDKLPSGNLIYGPENQMTPVRIKAQKYQELISKASIPSTGIQAVTQPLSARRRGIYSQKDSTNGITSKVRRGYIFSPAEDEFRQVSDLSSPRPKMKVPQLDLEKILSGNTDTEIRGDNDNSTKGCFSSLLSVLTSGRSTISMSTSRGSSSRRSQSSDQNSVDKRDEDHLVVTGLSFGTPRESSRINLHAQVGFVRLDFQSSQTNDIILGGHDLMRVAEEVSIGEESSGALTVGAVSTEALPVGAVSTEALPVGAVSTEALPAGAGSTGALPAGAVSTGSLPAGAVSTGALSARVLPAVALSTEVLSTSGVSKMESESKTHLYKQPQTQPLQPQTQPLQSQPQTQPLQPQPQLNLGMKGIT